MTALLLLLALPGAGPRYEHFLTPAQQKSTEVSNGRFLEVSALFGQKKVAEARKALDALIRDEEEVYGRYHLVTSAYYSFRADMLARHVSPRAALEDLDRVAEIDTRLYSWPHPRSAGARLKADLARRKDGMTPAQLASLREADTRAANLASLFRSGKRDEAIRQLRQVIATYTELLGPKHPRTATMRGNLGTLLSLQGQLEEASREYALALPALRGFLGDDNPELGHLLDGLAQLRLDQGRFDEGLALMRESIACFRTQGQRSDEYLQAIGRLAEANRKAGRAEEAVRLAGWVADTRRQVHGEKSDEHGTALNNLAAAVREAGDLRRAIRLLDQANAIARARSGRSTSYALGLANLSALYIDAGEYAQAAQAQDEALGILQKTLPRGHPELIQHLRRRALIHQLLGEHPAARRLFLQARALCKSSLGEKHPEYAACLGDLAFLSQEMGDLDEAAALFQQALALAPSAQLKNNLGLVRMHQRAFREALGLFRESAALTRGRGEDHATSLGNVAMAHRMLGEKKEALAAEREATRLVREARGEKHPAYAARLQNLAVLLADDGQRREALEACRLALRVKREALGPRHPELGITLINLATLAAEADLPRESARAAAEAVDIHARIVRDGFAGLSERQRLALLESLRQSLDAYLMHGDESVASAYEKVLAFKGALGASAAQRRLASGSPELARRLADLRAARADLATLSTSLPPPGRAEAWKARLEALERRKEELQAALTEDSPAFRALLAPPSPVVVAGRLPPASALVEVVEYGLKGERRLAAFLLRPGKAPVRVNLGPVQPIEEAVTKWREGAASTSGSPPAGSARFLRERVWLPIEKSLEGASTVLIAPDGPLTRLPFAALPGAKPGTFLLEERAVGYLTSGRQLLEPDGKREDGLLALGGATFGGLPAGSKRGARGFPAWAELPGAEIEARRVADLHARHHPRASSTLLHGARASRPGLLTALKKPAGYLHLATHGWFDAAAGEETTESLRSGEISLNSPADALFRRNPMLRTGLALAGANADSDNGYLTAEEAASLDLSSCRLAVLSACETGLGKLATWQGVQGLQQAFHQAGARNVAASLWSVSDPATSVLMEEMYAGIWGKGLSPLEAMRQAQLTVLNGPERVRKRIAELEAACRKAGIPEESLASRGIQAKAGVLPKGAKRSPVSWWAAWQLSGPLGK
jgi:CHAT domain-containing protein/tetratricopeptide (TPR) repeat protein